VQNVVAMNCFETASCKTAIEKADDKTINALAQNIVQAYVTAGTTDKGAKASCCATQDCNFEPIKDEPEASAANKLTSPLSFLAAFVLVFFY